MKKGFTVSRLISAVKNLVGGGRLSQRKNRPGSIRMMDGFTLIELMIAITIISVMASFGFSAYSSARDRQIGLAATEQILTFLQSNQSYAQAGNKDCIGKYLGQEVGMVTPNILRSKSICEAEEGSVLESTIPGIIFEADSTLIFNPLTKGIELSSGDSSLDIAYTSSLTLRYIVRVHNTGTIEYLGIQP